MGVFDFAVEWSQNMVMVRGSRHGPVTFIVRPDHWIMKYKTLAHRYVVSGCVAASLASRSSGCLVVSSPLDSSMANHFYLEV